MDNALLNLMEHKGVGNYPRNMLAVLKAQIDTRNAIAESKIPKDIREGEQGLQGGLTLGEVAGVPVNITDLLPADMGVNALYKGLGGLGIIGSVSSDVARLKKLLQQSGIDYDLSKSAKSPSTYFNIKTPQDDYFKVRISDHHDYHMGGDISIDPETGMKFGDAIKKIQDAGIPINSIIKSAPKDKRIIDDETITNIHFGKDSGKTINDIPKNIADYYRNNLVWQINKSHPSGGYWTEKR